MRIDEVVNSQQVDEINLKKALATGALALGTMGAAHAMPIAPGEPQVQMSQQNQIEKVEKDGNAIQLTYQGKQYPAEIINVDQARSIIKPGVERAKVSQAQLGYRGLGSYWVLLTGDRAYIVMK
jgi:hypothetical protein